MLKNPYRQADAGYLGCGEHLKLAEEVAEESVVLLKNDGVLPLENKYTKILVVGQSAEDIRCMYGDWTYFTHPLPDYDAPPRRPYCTFFEGVRELAAAYGCRAAYARGCEIESDDLSMIPSAAEAAKESDLIVFACGDNAHLAAEAVDRADITLTKSQKELFSALVKTGKPIVTALIATKPLCIPEVDAGSKAVITLFNGGMFGGRALAKALFGQINPCGKLPVSFPYHVGQQPAYYNQLPGWHCRSYVDMPQKPLYPFGRGLSFTQFEYSGLSFCERSLTLSVQITNIGRCAGKEVVQVYMRDLVSSVMTPVKRLIAFRKVALEAGESKRLEFTFTKKDFSFVNAREERVTEAGEFVLMAGGSSDDSDLLRVNFVLD